MSISRQFKALANIAAFFAGTWGVIGALIGAVKGPALTGNSVGSSAQTFAVMYATAGAIAGIATALLIGRAERGRHVGQLQIWRVAAWGVMGGLVPAALFGILGLLAGADISAVLPLAGLGAVGGGAGGLVASSVSVAAKRAALRNPDDFPRLPTS